MDYDTLRQNRINQELADLPFSSRTPRVQRRQQTNSCNRFVNDPIRQNKKPKKKLRTNFYEGITSERYYSGTPFSLSSEKYMNDIDTIEAHARFCKSKRPGQDIEESEKMEFFLKMKKNNYVHVKTYKEQKHDGYDINHDHLFFNNNNNRENKSSKNTKKSNFKLNEGSYPSFCIPYHERIRELIKKEMSIQNQQSNSTIAEGNDIRGLAELNNAGIDNEETQKRKEMRTQEFYTPNIHVTRRVKAYYIANNMEIPDFLQRIDPVPLRYDRIVHYHPDSVD